MERLEIGFPPAHEIILTDSEGNRVTAIQVMSCEGITGADRALCTETVFESGAETNWTFGDSRELLFKGASSIPNGAQANLREL